MIQGELEESAVRGNPVDPTEIVVLAVGIVVAVLWPSSSPWQSIGTPWDSRTVAMRFRC